MRLWTSESRSSSLVKGGEKRILGEKKVDMGFNLYLFFLFLWGLTYDFVS